MEKLAQLIIRLFVALWDRIEARKADQNHSDAVRADPGTHWLRRFGGRDARKASAASGHAERGDN